MHTIMHYLCIPLLDRDGHPALAGRSSHRQDHGLDARPQEAARDLRVDLHQSWKSRRRGGVQQLSRVVSDGQVDRAQARALARSIQRNDGTAHRRVRCRVERTVLITGRRLSATVRKDSGRRSAHRYDPVGDLETIDQDADLGGLRRELGRCESIDLGSIRCRR